MGGDGTSRVAAVRTVGVALANATPLQRVGRGSTENSPGGPQRGRVCGLERDPKEDFIVCQGHAGLPKRWAWTIVNPYPYNG